MQVTPPTVGVGQPGTIQITVADTEASGTKSAPAGTVSVTTPVVGAVVSPASCTLSAVTTSESSCSVTVTPDSAVVHAMTATYSGSAAHLSSSGAGSRAGNGS